MKNAYLIMAHHNFNQLSILLGLLDGFDNDLYVHIDSKAGAIDTDALRERVKKSNLVFIPQMSITWGGGFDDLVRNGAAQKRNFHTS